MPKKKAAPKKGCPYQLLGVERTASASQLRKAYHKCAARLHPDKVQGESVQVRALAEELFKALGEAYAAETGRLEAVDNALSA